MAQGAPMRVVLADHVPEQGAPQQSSQLVAFGEGKRAHVIPAGGTPIVFEVGGNVSRVIATPDAHFVAVNWRDDQRVDVVELFRHEGANVRPYAQFQLAGQHGPGALPFAFTASGEVLVLAIDPSGGADTAAQQVAIIDVATGAVRHRLQALSKGPAETRASFELSRIMGATLSADERIVVAAFGDNSIGTWDTRSGALLARLRPPSPEPYMSNDVAYVMSPSMVAFPSPGGVGVYRLDARKLGPPLIAPGCTGVRSLALDPSGALLAAGTTRGRLCVFEVASGHLLRAIDLPTPPRSREAEAWWVEYPSLPSSLQVEAHTLYESPHRFDIRTGAEVPVPPRQSPPELPVASKDGPIAVYEASFHGRAVVFGTRASLVELGSDFARAPATPGGVVLLGRDGRIYRAERRGAKIAFRGPGGPEVVFEGPFSSESPGFPELAISPDASMVAAVVGPLENPQVVAFDTRTGKPRHRFPLRSDHHLTAITFCSGGKLAFLDWTLRESGLDSAPPLHLELADLATGTVTRHPAQGLVTVAAHPTQPIVAVLSFQSLTLYDLRAPQRPTHTRKFPDWFEGGRLQFNTDGSELALTGQGSRVRFFDASLAPTRTLTADASVAAVAYSADGHLLAVAASRDLELFDARTHRPLGVLFAGVSGAAAVSPDGRVEVLGDRAAAERILLCHWGDRLYPYALCRARLEATGLLRHMLEP